MTWGKFLKTTNVSASAISVFLLGIINMPVGKVTSSHTNPRMILGIRLVPDFLPSWSLQPVLQVLVTWPWEHVETNDMRTQISVQFSLITFTLASRVSELQALWLG